MVHAFRAGYPCETRKPDKPARRKYRFQKGANVRNALKIFAGGLALAGGATAADAAVVVHVGTLTPNLFYNVAPSQISAISNYAPGSTVYFSFKLPTTALLQSSMLLTYTPKNKPAVNAPVQFALFKGLCGATTCTPAGGALDTSPLTPGAALADALPGGDYFLKVIAATVPSKLSTYRIGPTLSATFLAVVPEPANWAMMILGFGLIGTALRRRPQLRLAAQG
jgi:hypothetical protein